VPSFSPKQKIFGHCKEIDSDVHIDPTLRACRTVFQGKLKAHHHIQALILCLQIAVSGPLKLAFAAQHSKVTAKSPQNICGEDCSVEQRNLNQLYMRPVG